MYLIYWHRGSWNNYEIIHEYLVPTKELAENHVKKLNEYQQELLKTANIIDDIILEWSPIIDLQPEHIEIKDELSDIEKDAYKKWNSMIELDYFMENNRYYWNLEDRLRENLISQYSNNEELNDIFNFGIEIEDGIKQYEYKELKIIEE